MLINGSWKENWQPVQAKDEQGRFIRQSASFRHWITPDGAPGPTGRGGFRAEPGRYHLYVAYICPWASRVLMTLKLKGLEEMISVSVVNPRLSTQGWQFGGFPGATEDSVHGVCYLHQLYSRADALYTGRATVPVLWDKHTDTLVNNESADIIRMLGSAFDHLTGNTLNLCPEALAGEIDALNARLYGELNNGVYQAGFASSQQAYEEAYHRVFNMLDQLEARLGDGRSYLFGDTLTETDIRLFVTLVRFDAAYHGLFKCNRNTLASMANLWGYMGRILRLPGVADTVKLDHIKAGYYSIETLNPGGIVPRGPESL
ncbi:glutathione S-transferase family protein [Ferrimonas sediminicola]|uniref:Glutathione S-transferase family protein n=1 Tax=Ferrimonas sediminicola TaxID=2569538 RepID=A0A4U1BCE5_9GAMM|nr:glutathione S-transferase family protein [Ferrimonas sediminicola]TKB48336.1 glutathione S-transferase family protein [Ferrimonas sediminicola]